VKLLAVQEGRAIASLYPVPVPQDSLGGARNEPARRESAEMDWTPLSLRGRKASCERWAWFQVVHKMFVLADGHRMANWVSVAELQPATRRFAGGSLYVARRFCWSDGP
jgi:hypothetical protein